MRETLNWWLDPFMTTSVGPGPSSAPSLVVAGERDVVHPPGTGRQVAERLGADCLVIPRHEPLAAGEPGWEGVAEAALTGEVRGKGRRGLATASAASSTPIRARPAIESGAPGGLPWPWPRG